jgi:hypothetical protein
MYYFYIIHTVVLIVQYLLDMFTSKAQYFKLLLLYFISVLKFNYFIEHFKLDPIVYFDTYVADCI